MELRASNEFIFVNATRLRLDLDNYASFSHLLSVFRGSGIAVLRVHQRADAKQWLTLLSTLLAPTRESPNDRFPQVTGRLAQAGVTVFELGQSSDDDSDSDYREKAKEVAKRTYSQSVAVAT